MAILPRHLLEPAMAAVRETDEWDFKRQLDLTDVPCMLEVVKDIVAFANSGGGVILVGIDDDGLVATVDHAGLFEVDPATITNKIYAYTGIHFHAFEFRKVAKGTQDLCAILIGPVDVPLVFTRPGTYPVQDNKQRTAFSAGTVYFRHGAKSEPGTSDDLRLFMVRHVERVKSSLLEGISKVVQAPEGAHVAIVHDGTMLGGQVPNEAVRVTYEEDAPEYRAPLIEKTHPHRQKELLGLVNERLGAKCRVTTHDFLCVRRVHNIHRDLKYCYNLNWSSPRYSHACVDWMVSQIEADPMFLHRARESYSMMKEKGKRV